MKWTHEHFTGMHEPSNEGLRLLTVLFAGVDWDDKTKTKGVFRFTGGSHVGWSRWVDKENGNYDYLLGIDVSGMTSGSFIPANFRADRS
jgi:alpha-amylase